MDRSTPDPAALRSLWTLDSEIRFLNHGSFGACPRVVLEAQAEHRARLEREPVTFFVRELEQRLDAVREGLAEFLGSDPPDLAFVPNATTGVNAVLRSMELAPGDEIVITDHGYNACCNVARFVAERAGAVVRVASVPFPIRSGDEVLTALTDAVTANTRLLLVDHVTSPTGLVFPLPEIVDAMHARGVRVLVDGAHAPGMLELDLRRLDADYFTGNCHKWLCAPKGAGFLWVRRELQPSVRPAVISHGANSTRRDRSRFLLEFDWVGTVDPTALLAIPDAVHFLASLFPGGFPELRRRSRALALRARDVLVQALGIAPPAPDEMLGQLVSVPLPDGSAQAVEATDMDPLHHALFEEGRIEVPVFPWPAPPRRLVRASVQVYNEIGDYQALATGLRALLDRSG